MKEIRIQRLKKDEEGDSGQIWEDNSQVRIIQLHKEVFSSLDYFESDPKFNEKTTQQTKSQSLLKKLLISNPILSKIGLFEKDRAETRQKEKEHRGREWVQRGLRVFRAATRCLAQASYYLCCCLPCVPEPFALVRDNQTAVVSSFKRFDRSVDGGSPVFVDPFTESVEIFDNRIRSLQINQQMTFTKDFVKMLFNACVYYSLRDPSRFKYAYEDPLSSMVELCICLLKEQFSKLELSGLTKKFDDLCMRVENEANRLLLRRGVLIHRVFIKQVALFEHVEKLLSIEATMERMRQCKMQLIRSEIAVTAMQDDPSLVEQITQNKRIEVLSKLSQRCNEGFLF